MKTTPFWGRFSGDSRTSGERELRPATREPVWGMSSRAIFPCILCCRGVSGAMRSEEVLPGDTRDDQSSGALSAESGPSDWHLPNMPTYGSAR